MQTSLARPEGRKMMNLMEPEIFHPDEALHRWVMVFTG
jgi:hypothetical protein